MAYPEYAQFVGKGQGVSGRFFLTLGFIENLTG